MWDRLDGMLSKIPRTNVSGEGTFENNSRESREGGGCGCLEEKHSEQWEKCRMLDRDGKSLKSFKQKSGVICFMLKYRNKNTRECIDCKMYN